ncbi:MAG: hypothetical protein WCC60_05780 [Ilumatobacteraceae bacterium]
MCDCLVALPPATAGAVTLFAKNSDRPPAERQVVHWSPSRRDGATLRATHIDVAAHPVDTLACVLSRPAWGWGAEHGVNEAGVAIGNTTVYTTLDPRGAAVGLTGMDMVRLALERAATATQAVEVIVELLMRYGQGGSGHDPALVPHGRPYWNAFLVAAAGDAFVIDTSGTDYAVERVTDARAISNRTTIPAFDAAHRHPRQPVERLVDPRWHASQRVLAARPVTVESLQAHLRSHDSCGDPGWSVCMHAEGVEATTASMIVSLQPDTTPWVWALTGSPCEREYTAFAFEDAAGLDLTGV